MPRPKVVLKPFTLRLPDELYRALEQIAEAEIRPVNSQILVFLRHAVEQWHRDHGTSPLESSTEGKDASHD